MPRSMNPSAPPLLYGGAIKIIGLGLLSETLNANLNEEWDELIDEEFHLYAKMFPLIQAEGKTGHACF